MGAILPIAVSILPVPGFTTSSVEWQPLMLVLVLVYSHRLLQTWRYPVKVML